MVILNSTKEFTENSMIEKLILFLFKSRYKGLYFWGNSSSAEKRARETVVGDLLSIMTFSLAIFILLFLKLYPVDELNSEKYGAYRPAILIGLGVLAFLIGRKIDKVIEAIVAKNKPGSLNLKGYSKKSALPNFILVLLSPLLTIVVFFLTIKTLISLF